jgi:hypothetical protein
MEGCSLIKILRRLRSHNQKMEEVMKMGKPKANSSSSPRGSRATHTKDLEWYFYYLALILSIA